MSGKIMRHGGRIYRQQDVARMPVADACEARTELTRWLRDRPASERRGWGPMLVELDRRCGDRPPVVARSDNRAYMHDRPGGIEMRRTVAERTAEAREALFKDRSRAKAREQARELRRVMLGEGKNR